jgi:hypothetical protein
MDYKKQIGFDPETGLNSMPDSWEVEAIINDRLSRLTSPGKLAPVDKRIQAYLDKLMGAQAPKLPTNTVSVDMFGIARTLSLPPDKDEYINPLVSSYRLRQGMLHNPKNDRRTTKGVFHVAEGGLPIPADKKAVPLPIFAELFKAALRPTSDLMLLPYTSTSDKPTGAWLTTYLRPLISPEVPGVLPYKSMEVRFLVPGGLASNIDFIESVFGNAGDPVANDAALDVEHWSGHTGFVLLAPHLTTLTKKALGLPHFDDATPRQQRDGMCWKDEKELYNDGQAFKATSRDENGVIVTVIADNYFGYCKKEVKTQISYAANLFGLCEEEHAGGALTFASYDVGEDFALSEVVRTQEDRHFDEAVKLLDGLVTVHPEGYAVDRRYPDIVYVPQRVRMRLHDQKAEWENEDGKKASIKLLPNHTYVLPSGYKINMMKPGENRRWRLIGTVAEPCFCHKPSTVSGGGKSEISKPLSDACIIGSVFVMDFKNDMDQVEMLLDFDYSDIYKESAKRTLPPFPIKPASTILSPHMSLGMVIQLFSPSSAYTDSYNDFLRSIPPHVIEMLLVIKRYYKPDWEEDWKKRFSVDSINGVPGHELKYRRERLSTLFLRVGYERDGGWRTLGVRKDFSPAYKIQMEDDITASIVLPTRLFKGLGPSDKAPALKFTGNCEYRLFQRPDDAVVRGYDKQTEHDMTLQGNFTSNYQPLTKDEVKLMVEDAIRFDHFTKPLQDFLRGHAEDPKGPQYAMSPSNPRIVDGAISKNTRYLQNRPDFLDLKGRYLAEIGIRLARRLKPTDPIYTPVTIIVPGRRNNPPEKGTPALCAFNPIHYMELPELFMEFISSMTGKSPSTTGAGSEGALTKGPFNALLPIIDLNAAYVSAVLTQAPTYVSSAAYVGPKFRVDHDVSLLIPEIFARMTATERDPAWLIKNGYLERCRDFTHGGKLVQASRLGWRITAQFERFFFGRVFNSPGVVLNPEMLRPEIQDKDIFADAVNTIVETHQRVAELYFDDGGVELAVPPLKALLHVMAKGSYEGMKLTDEAFRKLFTLDSMLSSSWYAERLQAKQRLDIELWQKHSENITAAIADNVALKNTLEPKLAYCQKQLSEAMSQEYMTFLKGTIGVASKLR